MKAKHAKRYKRKQMFSNPRVQLRVMLAFSILAVLFTVTNCFISRQLLTGLTSQLSQLPLSPGNRNDLLLILSQQGWNVTVQLTIFVFLSVFVLVMAGAILSHRIGGPIYQLTKYLEDLTKGSVKPRRIKFRKHDFFHQLATVFNRFQESHGMVPPPGEDKKKS